MLGTNEEDESETSHISQHGSADDLWLSVAARKRAAYHDGDGAERDGPTPYRYVPRETENQVGRARGQDGLAPDTEEAPVCLGVSGRWAELGQADKEMGRVF